MKLVYK